MIHRILLCLLLGLLASCKKAETIDPKPVVEVRVIRAEETDLHPEIQAPGSVFARDQANIASRLTAPIRELRAKKGDTVAAGQVLALLENRDILAQRAEATAAIADAEATLGKMESGTLPSEIERARGQVATTEAALNQAQKFYERRKLLFEQGAIPGRDLLMSETELAQAKTNHEVARKSLQLLKSQSKERDIQIARSRLEQARARLSFIEAQVAFAEVRSPFAGAITEQFVFPGDMAKPDSPLFTVADLSLAVVRAQVPAVEATLVHPGQICVFDPADQPGSHPAGRVTVVNQAVDRARRTVEVWCEIPNPRRSLRAGEFGSLRISDSILSKVIVVPVAAVQFEEGGRKGIVMVADAQRRAVRRECEIGAKVGGRVEIRQGIQAGEMVIVEGGYGLPEGTEVRW